MRGSFSFSGEAVGVQVRGRVLSRDRTRPRTSCMVLGYLRSQVIQMPSVRPVSTFEVSSVPLWDLASYSQIPKRH